MTSRSLLARLLWALCLLPALAVAQEAPSGSTQLAWDSLQAEQQALLAPFAERWDALPLGQRAQLLANAERLLELPEAERRLLKERMGQWQALPPAERARLRERFEAYRALTPEQQRRLRGEFQRFRDLPPAQRAELRQRFQAMSPAERRAFLLGARARDQAELARRAFAFVPPEQREATWEMFRQLSADDRQRLRRLVERMPPWRREQVRQTLLEMAPEARSDWLRQQLAQR